MKKELKRLEGHNCSIIRRSLILTEYSNTLNSMLKDLVVFNGKNSTIESETKQIKINKLIHELENCLKGIFNDLSEITPNLKKLLEKGYLISNMKPLSDNDQNSN